MDLTIQNKFDNQLLGRIDVSGQVSFTGATPSNAELAAAIGVDADHQAFNAKEIAFDPQKKYSLFQHQKK